MPRKLYECEFCGEFVIKTPDDTVCNDCDRKMAEEHKQEMSLKAAAHAAKYKCKHCGDGLPTHRARLCEYCDPSETRETEDLFELVEDVESEERDITRSLRKKTLREMALPRECTSCKQTKPASEFSNETKSKDGKNSNCKKCCLARAKMHDQRARERLRRLKEQAGLIPAQGGASV